MFLDNMTTDEEPADYRVVARSLARKLKRERVRNAHLHQLLRERNFHLKRLHGVVLKLRKLQGVEEKK